MAGRLEVMEEVPGNIRKVCAGSLPSESSQCSWLWAEMGDTVTHTVSSSLGTQEGYHSMTAGGLVGVRCLGSGGWK